MEYLINHTSGGGNYQVSRYTMQVENDLVIFTHDTNNYHGDISFTATKDQIKTIYEYYKDRPEFISAIFPMKTEYIVIKHTSQKIKDIDFDSLSKEELLKFIKAGKTYIKDTDVCIDEDFGMQTLRFPKMMIADIVDGELASKIVDSTNIVIDIDFEINESKDFNKLILDYKKDIQEVLTQHNKKYMYRFYGSTYYITDKLIAKKLIFKGSE